MRYMGTGRGGAFEWLFQRVSGIALAVILLLHFVILHYTGSGAITYDTVAPRLASPFYKGWELLFLSLALYHAMNGIKLVIDDYVHVKPWRIVLTGLNWVWALGFFLFGAVTILTFQYQP